MTVLLVGVNTVYLAVASGTSLFYVCNILAHPLLGAAATLAFAAWWWPRRDDRATAIVGLVVWLGLACGLALVAVSLLVPGSQARGPLLWGHVGATVLGAAGLLWARRPGRFGDAGSTRGLWHPAAALFVLAVGVALVSGMARSGGETPDAFVNPPAAADFAGEAMGGADGLFHPSAAHTGSGAVLPAVSLPPAESCAGAGCHDAAVAEWRASPHRWSGRENPWYRVTLAAFEADVGAAATGWCAGCHEPGRLVTGAGTSLDGGDGGQGAATTGVSCATCHGLVAAKSTIGQGQYVLEPPGAARLAGGGAGARRLHRWAVRLDPGAHARAWSPAALTGPLSPETCATCHKAHFDEPLNGYRWLQHMNDYDQWQASHISGYGGRSFYRPEPRTCVDCHMPRHDGGARSHRFAAADAATAVLSGDPEQLAAVEASLASGAVTVDLFAAVVGDTRIAPVDGAAVPAGASLRLDVVVATPGMGHFFPGGKLDTADVWLELAVRGGDGDLLAHSGALDDDGSLDPAAHRYRQRMIDGDLQPLDHGDLWRGRAEVYRQWIMPLGAEVVRYRLALPAERGELEITARLHFRELSAELQEWTRAHLDDAAPVAPPAEIPALVVAQDRATLRVVGPEEAPEPPAGDGAEHLARRFNDYGIGLFLQGDTLGARRAFERVTALTPEDADAWLNLAWTAILGGDLAGMEEAVVRAEELAPDLARTVFFRGRLEQSSGNTEEAVAAYRAAIEPYPQDRVSRVFLLRALMEQERYAEALEETARILKVDPEYSLAHYNAMLAHRASGNEEEAEWHRVRYERFRPDDTAQALTGPYLEEHPHDNLERQAIHEHVLDGEAEE